MQSVTLLHVADTHLGFRQYGLVEREADIYQVFHEIVETALKERVDLIVHSGDFFDTVRPPAQALIHAVRALKKLRDGGIPFIVVPGDHDLPKHRAAPPLMLLHELGLVMLLSSVTTTSYRVRVRSGVEVLVAGVENHRAPQSHVLRALIAKLNEPTHHPAVLILHQSLRECSPSYELQMSDLPRGFSYYALGHIHLTKILWKGEAAVAYPGSSEALKLDEVRAQPERYVLLAEVEGKRTIRVDRLRLKSPRPQLYLEVEPPKLESALRELAAKVVNLASVGKHPLVHIIVKGAIEDKRKLMLLLERLLGKHALMYRVVPVAEATSEAKEELKSTPSRIDLREVLSRMLGDPYYVDAAISIINALSVDPRPLAIAEASRLVDELHRRFVDREREKQ